MPHHPRLDEEQAAGRAALPPPQSPPSQERVGPAVPLTPHEFAELYRNITPFERFVIQQLVAMRQENDGLAHDMRRLIDYIHKSLAKLEITMDATTRALMDAVTAADSKLEGYVVLLTSSVTAINKAVSTLTALKNEPTSTDIQAVIDQLNSHVDAVGTGVNTIVSSTQPLAPAPAQSTPGSAGAASQQAPGQNPGA